MPNCPRLMLPPHPVSTTSEMPTRHHTTAKVRVVTVDGVPRGFFRIDPDRLRQALSGPRLST